MSDVDLYPSGNAGEIAVTNGQIDMVDGLRTAVSLSLFGGNAKDSGGDDGLSSMWWGNYAIANSQHRQRSQTQYLLRNTPITSGNLIRFQHAAEADLAWFVSDNVATSVSVSVSATGAKSLRFDLLLVINGETFPISVEGVAS